jgi:alpha-2-macroglobulin
VKLHDRRCLLSHPRVSRASRHSVASRRRWRYAAPIRTVSRHGLVLALLVLAACIRGSSVPSVTPAGTLAVGDGEHELAGSAAPFQVVFAAPKGTAALTSQISVVFSRSLRPLQLAEQESPPPIQIRPAVQGQWQWVGTNAILFTPQGGHLPGATHFYVQVPAGVHALDGSVLAKAYRFDFTTPRPALARSSPSNGSMGLVPSTPIELMFNQPIDPAVLAKNTKLTADRGGHTSVLAFAASYPDPSNPKRIALRLPRPLPIHSSIRIAVSADLTGKEGPLPAGITKVIDFQTYGPLEVTDVSCDHNTPHGRCAPGNWLGLTLSNPVRLRDLRRLLSITPSAHLDWRSWSDDEMTTYVGLQGRFVPGREYLIRIDGSLRDRYGQTMGKPFVEHVAIDDVWPTVEVGVNGDVLEPEASRPIPIGSVNTRSYELVTGELQPKQLAEFFSKSSTDNFQYLAGLRNVRRQTLHPGGAKNRMVRHDVAPARLLGGPQGRGAIAIGVKYDNPQYPAQPVTRITQVVQVTDLAISAKVSRQGSLVWVTRLSNGQPVAGATVELVRPGLPTRRYTADKQGIARIPPADYSRSLYDDSNYALIVARAGHDWAFKRVADYIGPWRLDVPSDLSGVQHDYGMMFTERGIYRPGDTVKVKAILRKETPSGNAVPAGRRLTVELLSSRGDVVLRKPVTTTRFGTFALDVKVPQSAALGSWQLQTQGLDEGSQLSESFEVAEYRLAEFKVGVASNHPSYIRGDKAHWTVHGDYLFGAPMSGASVRYSITRSPTWFSPPGSDGFTTDADTYYADLTQSDLNAGALATGHPKLDKKGAAQVSLELALPGQHGPELVTNDAEVTDISRQSQSGSTSAIVHPGEFYLGLKNPTEAFYQAPASIQTSVIAVTPDGRRLSGRHARVELVRRRWTIARQNDGGRMHVVSKVVDRVVGHCDIVTAPGGASCSVEARQGGYYLLHATARDGRGNPIEAATSLYVLGAGEASWGDTDKLSVKLALDKKQYKVGDTARVLVKSPFRSADALVTVERAGVYRAWRTELKGPMPTVRVPVTADLGPNAFVSVLLVRRRDKAPPEKNGVPDVGAPAYRIGYAPINIDPSAHRLKVRVTPSASDFRPGGTVSVDLKVADTRGEPRPAEVTLYAVDEGVLSLTGYQVPDPVPVFTASRPITVATLESRDTLAHVSLADLMGELGQQKGGDGGGGGTGHARSDFRQTAYFNPSVLTDAKGHARVSFKLPESLTTYRIMAIAVTDDDRYGFGETRVTTSERLMARPELPRFVRAGDEIDAGIVVTAKDFGPTAVHVRANVTGLTLEGPATRTIQLGHDASEEVRFKMRAVHAGTAKLRFDVEGGGERDAVRVTRKVEVPMALEAVALYGKTDGASGEKLGDLSSIRRDVGDLDVSVSSTALVGLGDGVEQLLQYPYGCTEQLSSRLLPLLPLRDLAHDFHIAMPPNMQAIINDTVAKIVRRQLGDGGFGLWPDSRKSFPWVSAYALWTLHQAKLRGTYVPKHVMDGGTSYVRRFLAENRDGLLYRATAAFMLDVLAELGAPDPGYMNDLYSERSELPLFARALLLHAMAISKQDPDSIHKLAQEIENQLILHANTAGVADNLGDQYAVLMDSPARTAAMVLRALLVVDPKLPLGSKLARGLLAARRHGTWRNTQETAYALLALNDYRKAQETAVPDYTAQVWLGQHELLRQSVEGRNAVSFHADAPAAQLGSGGLLTFQKSGTGTLFYEARLRYAPQSLPTASLDRGFFVQKTLRTVTPEGMAEALKTIPEVSARDFSGGDLVIGDLVVVTPSPRDYVVIDDPLPAGFEGVDATLSTTASWLKVAGSGGEPGAVSCVGCDYPEDDALARGTAFLASWYRREVHDDRVEFFVDHMAAGMYHYRYLARATTFGHFILPPTEVKEMYTPEVFGRTGAESVDVR